MLSDPADEGRLGPRTMGEARRYSAPPLFVYRHERDRESSWQMALLHVLACVPSLLLAPAPLRSHAFRTPLIIMSSEDSTTGKGFGDAAAEERGRKALEALREASGEKGYDNSLQGLRSPEEEPPVEVPQEFKSTVTLGFAGFLIVFGVISLILGGSLWEPKDFNEDGTPPADNTPAFGFVPTARERAQVQEALGIDADGKVEATP